MDQYIGNTFRHIEMINKLDGFCFNERDSIWFWLANHCILQSNVFE